MYTLFYISVYSPIVRIVFSFIESLVSSTKYVYLGTRYSRLSADIYIHNRREMVANDIVKY